MTRLTALLALVTAAASLAALETDARAADAAPGTVYEMRIYYPNPGKMDALHARFRDHTNALLTKHGAKLIGHWVTQPDAKKPDDQPKLVWIAAYPSLEAREKTWKAFVADPDWIKAKADSEKDGPLVAKADSIYMNPTDYSPAK